MQQIKLKKVDYDMVRLLVKTRYDQYRNDSIKRTSRIKQLRVRGAGVDADYEGKWHNRINAKETRQAKRSSGNAPLLTAPVDDHGDYLVTPCENQDDNTKALLNYFYNFHCPKEEITHRKLYSWLWLSFRETLARKNVKPKVMIACYDMLGELLHRYRRHWIKGGKFKDFEWDDVVSEGESISRDAWYKTYKDYWFKIRAHVEQLDQACLDKIRNQI